MLSGVYLALTALFISTQGIFGESFIVIILGLPWSLVPAYFEFGNIEGFFVYMLVLVPLVLNAAILYAIGHGISRIYKRSLSNH